MRVSVAPAPTADITEARASTLPAVVYLSSTAQLGGAERSLLDLAHGMHRAGARVCLVCLDEGPLTLAAAAVGVTVEVVQIPRAFRRTSVRGRRSGLLRLAIGVAAVVPAAMALRRLFCRQRPRIVHANGPKAQLLGLMASIGLDLRLVWHVRDFMRDAFVERMLVRLSNWRAAAVIANSHAVAAHLRRLGVRAELVHAVHNGIDCARFDVSGPAASFHTEYGWPLTAPVVGMLAAFARWKGQHTFVEAARLVLARRPDARFVLVGDEIYATDGHGQCRRDLTTQIGDAGLERHVALAGWRDDIPEVLRALSVVVHASTEPEPFGRVIAEALACSVPVVATFGGGVTEITGSEGVATLVPPADPVRLAAAIVETLDNPGAARARAAAGRTRIEECFSLGRHLTRMREVYDEVCPPRRLSVVHAGKFYPPSRGGMETALAALCEGTSGRWDVRAVVANEARATIRERRDGAEIIRAGLLARVASVPLCPSLPVHLWTRRSDCLVLHEPYPWAAAALWLRCPARRLIIWHHSDILRPRWARHAYGWLQRALYRRASCVVVASHELAASSTVVPAARRVEVIPFGIDVGRFAALDGLQRERAWRLRAAGRTLSALFVGRLVYYKGVDVLLRALARCDLSLRIVGDGPEAPGLRQLALELGLEGRVDFVTGVSDDDLPAYYHAADVFVLPSVHHTETFGLVQVEAMAAGIPVVSTRLPTGVPWVNQHDVTGLVVTPGDVAALADALRRLAADASLRRRMGEAGRRRAEQVFSRRRMLEDFTALVEDVVG